MPARLSGGQRDLLVLLQDEFPLVPAPFYVLGERLLWREQEVLSRIWALKAQGPLRQISAIFDTRRLGYSSTLVALRVQPDRLEAVGRAISQHPGVSHNYSREHTFNLWFTLAVPPGIDLEREVQALADQPGVRRVLNLPVVRTFKIGVRFGMGRRYEPEAGEVATQAPGATTDRLLPADIPFVRALQEDLPLSSRPFLVLARRAGLSEDGLLEAAERFLASGVMRRYGATLHHRQVGYTANAMVCWQVAEGRIVIAGQAAARHPAVSHCYQRPAYPPDWPYQLFTMVHARSQEELAGAIAGLERTIRPLRIAVLPTVREFKKVRLRYFEEGEGELQVAAEPETSSVKRGV